MTANSAFAVAEPWFRVHEARLLMEWVDAKSLLSSRQNGDNWFGWDYNMNIYRGCCHGCIYCDSRCDCYHVEDFHRVRAKKNAIALLDAQLRGKRHRGVVGTGSMSDPYNPFEAKQRLTRQALERLAYHGFGVGIATKSDLIARDVDCLTQIARNMPVLAKLTITCCDDDLAARLEPYAPSPTRRWRAVEALSKAGLFTGILLMPLLPWITDSSENIASLVGRAADCGARFIYPGLGITLRMNQRAYFYQEVDKHFPGMARRYAQHYGDESHCACPNAQALWEQLEAACQKRGLLCRMPDIIAASRLPYQHEQLRLEDL